MEIFELNPTSNERKKQKRQADNSLVLSDDESENSNSFPTFLVVEATNNEPIKLSIFAIQKLLKCGVGDVKNAKKLRNGAVLVEVASKVQANKALALSSWVNGSMQPLPIKVTPHRSLNTCKGVIRCQDLRDCSDDEVLEELKTVGVTQVKHIMSKRNGILTPTNTFVLTFSKPTLPKSIKAAYHNIPVEPFIPNPLRCYNCQKFGHGQSACHNKLVCARCGKLDHKDADCTEQEPKCANCSGHHPAYSRDCPMWIEQQKIVKLKTERNISFNEAKQLIKQQSGSTTFKQNGKTYAAMCKSTSTISTQTDLTWPNNATSPTNTATSQSNIVTQTDDTDDLSHLGAVGGQPAAKPKTTNIPHYKTSTPNKPSNSLAASSKSTLWPRGKAPKGSTDPIKLHNRFGSLDHMDEEFSLSPGTGSGGRKK